MKKIILFLPIVFLLFLLLPFSYSTKAAGLIVDVSHPAGLIVPNMTDPGGGSPTNDDFEYASGIPTSYSA